MSIVRCALIVCAAASFSGSPAYAQSDSRSPCEAYSQSQVVFVGVAMAPVSRTVQLPDHPPVPMTLIPMTVEGTYLGDATQMRYVSIEGEVVTGTKYLVYGSLYEGTDVALASPVIGFKKADESTADLEFLEAMAPSTVGGTIDGSVQWKHVTYERETVARAPLDGIRVRIFNDRHSTDVVTDTEGRFIAAGIPAGTYELAPHLPEGLVILDPTTPFRRTVRDGGCARASIEVLFNGRVRGTLRGPDGSPLRATSVDIIPTDVKPEPASGHIAGAGSVSTNDRGEFEFKGLPEGNYYLGVSLYNAPNESGPSYPRTYYPGTTDRAGAVPVVVERGQRADGFDFSIPAVLPKGELEYVVETDRPGKLTFCFVRLEDLVKKWSEDTVAAGQIYRRVVVEGQHYQIHVHLDVADGTLESEPFIFTGTTGKTVATLRPDAPRKLH